MKRDACVLIGGIVTSTRSSAELCEMVVSGSAIDQRGPRLLFDINGQGLAMSLWNSAYRADLQAAEVVHADGQPLVTVSRWLTKTPIADRSATTDLFIDVAAAAAQAGKSFYLLGATEEVSANCARIMESKFRGLKIVGRRNGYFRHEDEDQICQEINDSGADIVWVGLGKPLEQAFCTRNKQKLCASWLVTCGGCFNFVTGSYARAPRWMQNTGLEWLHRMITLPRQLAWRYLTTTPVALYLLLTRTREC